MPSSSVDRILSNPPYGKQLGEPEEIGPLYRAMMAEYARVLKPMARAILVVADQSALVQAAREAGMQPLRQLSVQILGQSAQISIWRNDRL